MWDSVDEGAAATEDTSGDTVSELSPLHVRRGSKGGNPVWDSVDEGPYRAAMDTQSSAKAGADDATAATPSPRKPSAQRQTLSSPDKPQVCGVCWASMVCHILRDSCLPYLYSV